MSDYKIFAIYYMGESYDGGQWAEEECDSKPESDPEVFEIRKDGKEVVSRTDFDETKFICDRLNACDGIPSDQLGEVKKAMLVANLYSMLSAWYDDAEMDMVFTLRCGLSSEQHMGQLPDPNKLILMAKKLRSRGADFGELNALIDSVKE